MAGDVIQALHVKELHTGAYAAKGAEGFAGYITIIDEGGTARKIMVCA